MKTCGELLVEMLEKYGVDTVFGIPGVHTVELYRGLPNTQIRHITPRHEQGAGFMADGYARASGKVGVCFIITGPGMTNIMTAMGQAYADSIPMLVISSVNPIKATGSQAGHLHELADQSGMVANVAAFSKTVWSPENLPSVLAEAFAVFKSARPLPVHIQIPIDVITADASHVKPIINHGMSRPKGDETLFDQAVGLLKQAKNPVLLYGGGCVDVNADAVKLAEALDVPTCLTINAKGLLPPAHPLSLGSNQSLPSVRQLIKEADVVLAIGTELGETDYDVVFDGGFDITGKIIRIDIDAHQLNRSFVCEIGIVSDAQYAVTQLYKKVKDLTFNHNAKAIVQQIKQQLIADFSPAISAQTRLLQLVRDTLPEVIIVGDSTQPVYGGNLGYEAIATRRWFNSSTGFGTLGYGLPAGIGAKLSVDAPVVVLIGDGGIQFTIAELITAAGLQLPIIIVLWNNQGYGEIKRYMQDRDLPTIGVDIKTPKFDLLAQGFGVNYRRITTTEDFINSLKADSQGNIPMIYEINEADGFLVELGKSVKYFT